MASSDQNDVLTSNIQFLMYRIFVPMLVITAYLLLAFQIDPNRMEVTGIGTVQTVQYYRVNSNIFAANTKRLEEFIEKLSKDTLSRDLALNELKACRKQYKKIEFFTSYFFNSETRLINAAPVIEVEEPTLEFVESMGMQQIETLLFDQNYLDHKSELSLQAGLLQSTASQLTHLLYNFQITDSQILESLRIDLIRVITLSISGYDAPELKTGILEAQVCLETMMTVLKPYFDKNPSATTNELKEQVEKSIDFLSQNTDFNSFDRLQFLTGFALPLQSKLGQAIQSWGLELNTQKHLNYEKSHLLSKGAVQLQEKALDANTQISKIQLGKKLFLNNSLSGNGQKSCATCHSPESFFNDNLFRSASIDPDSILKRNTPTLLYASAQHMQFWDGRVSTLEDQILHVIFNPLEMNGDPVRINKEILKNKEYQKLFSDAFPNPTNQEITVKDIARSIAAFINTLQPNTSSFDEYINGNTAALTERQVNGFNIFMGKAQCGTCHFLPNFNSLLPPHYEVSEVEILGTPANADLENPQPDKDRGRFDLFHVKYYDGAFKTPTVRNAAKTAPYMHNGVFKTMMEVVEFYNRGGGEGIGLQIAEQTLSSKSLNLTQIEKENICLFIESLTDKI